MSKRFKHVLGLLVIPYGGGLAALGVFFLILVLIPVAAAVSIAVRWFQTRKAAISELPPRSVTLVHRKEQ